MAFAPPFQRVFPATFDRRAAAAGNGLLNNLVAYWKLDEAAGANNALDVHTNSLTLTQANSPGSAAGKIGTARSFNGFSQRFHRASEALLQTGNVDFTFSVWVNITIASTYHWVLGKDDLGSNREYSLLWDKDLSPDSFEFAVWNVSGQAKIAAWDTLPTTSTWYHVVCWHDSVLDTVNILVNNGAVSSTAMDGSSRAVGSAAFTIGATSIANNVWNGAIDEVGFWKSAAGGGGVLTAAQRTALYNNGAGLAYAQFTT